MEERIVITTSAEQKKLIQEEAKYQRKTMKDLILEAVFESRRMRLAGRSRVPEFDGVLDDAKKEWSESHSTEGEKMQKLTRIFSGVAEKVTGQRAWKWSGINISAWEKLCEGRLWPEGGQAVFSFDGEGWTPQNVTSKPGLCLATEGSACSKKYYIANDYAEKWDVEAMIREIIAKEAK